MSREKHFEAIDTLIRTTRGSDENAAQELLRLIEKAIAGLPSDETAREMISALKAEFDIFLASSLLYGENDPALGELRKQLLARFAKLRAWLLIVEKRDTEVRAD